MEEVLKDNKKIKSKKNYYIICAINFLHGLVFMGAVTSIFRAERGITLEQMIIMEAVLTGAMIVLEIPFGMIADKFGYKKIIVLACFLNFISKILNYTAYSFFDFLVQRILLGMAISAMSGCDSAIIHNSLADEEREKAYGKYMMLGTISYLVASICSSFMTLVSVEFTALVTIIPYGIAFLVSLMLEDIKIEGQEKTSQIFLGYGKNIFSDILDKYSISIILIVITLVSYCGWSTDVLFAPLQFERAGINVAMFGVITAMCELPCLLSGQIYKFTQRFGQVKVLNFLVILLFIASFNLIFTSSKLISIILIIFAKFSFAMMCPIIMDIENRSIKEDSKNRATILSAYSMVGGIVEVLFGFIIAFFVGGKVELAFVVTSIFSGASFMVLVFLKKYIKNLER